MLVMITKILYKLVQRLLPENNIVLTQQSIDNGDTVATFQRQVAINIVGFCMHLYLGPYCMFTSLSYIGTDQPQISCETELSAQEVAYCDSSSFSGLLFTAYCLYQVIGLLLGWEKGLELWFHHIVFTSLGCLCLSYWFMPTFSGFAIAMEISTPALLVRLTFRRLVGYERVVSISSMIFAPMFLFSRVFVFGYAVIIHLAAWYYKPEIYTSLHGVHRIPITAITIVMVLYTIGWFLQIFWAVSIVKTALKVGKKPKVK